jgi:CsoR family transcriptional regulator, copper-sensing transcriptional repressor
MELATHQTVKRTKGKGQTATASANCGCDSKGSSRHAIAVDPGIKSSNQKRLRRIEGQVRGLQRMVEDDRYCADILTQISSVQEALGAVSRELLRNHLRHCATHAIRAGTSRQAEEMYEELLALLSRKIG